MKKILTLLALLSGSNFAHATIYDFSVNNGWQELLSGYVDTQRDALLITSVTPWEPGLHHNVSSLTPDFTNHSLFPNGEWELGAVDASGAKYDISDDWDGLFGGGWGFASAIDITAMPYTNGSISGSPYFKYFTAINMYKTYFTFPDFYTYDTFGPSPYDPHYTTVTALPGFVSQDPASLSDFPSEASNLSHGVTYSATKKTSVPEPSPLALFSLALAFILLRKLKAK